MAIEVRSQVRLSLTRTFSLCIKGIKHRFFRSVLTTLVIVLAVAFFMFLLGDSVIARGIGAGVHQEIRRNRAAPLAVDLWTGIPSPATLSARLAKPDAPLSTFAAFCGWTDGRMLEVAESCRRQHTILAWLDGLDAGTRTQMVDVAQVDEAFPVLATDAGWQVFTDTLASHRGIRTPLSLPDIQTTARTAPRTTTELIELAGAWKIAVSSLGEDLNRAVGATDQSAMLQRIAEADRSTLAAVAKVLAQHGWEAIYTPAELTLLQADLRLDRQRDAVVRALRSEEGNAAWMKAFRRRMTLDEKLALLTDPLAGEVLSGKFPAAELSAIAAAARRDRDLERKEHSLTGLISEDGLLTARQGFLVLISLMVCMVGIANAMLMAITERFREIATMKCLGATDGYILTQFLLEAGIQGLCGGAIGMVIGLLLTLLKSSWFYGMHLVWYFPAINIAIAAVICVVIGLLLATFASIYPSWMASRMAPMEAMRIE